MLARRRHDPRSLALNRTDIATAIYTALGGQRVHIDRLVIVGTKGSRTIMANKFRKLSRELMQESMKN